MSKTISVLEGEHKDDIIPIMIFINVFTTETIN